MPLDTYNPATGERLATYEEHDEDEVRVRLERAWSAWGEWRSTPIDERAKVLSGAADALERRRDDLAALITLEMGKPITESRGEIDKCAWACRHYAERGAEYLAPERIETDATRTYVRFDPIGPVLAVMPWNFPFWQVFRFIAPNLVAGNVGLLKHATNTTGSSIAIEEVMMEAGAPTGVFQSLIIGSSRVEAVIDDERVRAVTLTGSEGAGRAVAAAAGQRIKKTVLELGGSDAFVVLADADVAKAAEVGAQSRMINTGQSCIAAKRFILEEAIADEWLEQFAGHMTAMKVGDPMDDDTQVGPLARDDLRDDLDDQLRRSVDAGARVVTGGERIDRPGWFYAPTVLDGVRPEMPAGGAEETFGPLAGVIRVRDEDEAIAVANDADFGLGASLWTEDRERGERLAERVEAGCVMINQLVKSDPRVPFGGVKNSGYGRELAREGAREFTNVKTVWVE